MSITVHQFACLEDNYGYLVRDDATGFAASHRHAGRGRRTGGHETETGWTLHLILNTHWHARPRRRQRGGESGDGLPDRRPSGGDAESRRSIATVA